MDDAVDGSAPDISPHKNCPLTLKLRATGQFYAAPLELLAQRSDRWHSANLWIYSTVFRHISFTKGKFSLLGSLQIHGDFLHGLDIFEAAAFATSAASLGQIRSLNYEDGNAPEFRAFVPLISLCPRLTAVTFMAVNVSALSLPLELPAQPELPPVLDVALTAELASLQRRSDIWYSIEAAPAFGEI
ncbi:hypothetical protein DFH09DRAFT_1326461 [Mycena vulgaris]|nr:hypothetical protein DFH09DRAFT_1326461 [Mycena vulgaris]